MEIILNGEKAEAPEGETAAMLIQRLKLAGPVAALVNGEVIHREKLASTIIKPGDQVELLRMMGGG